MKGTTQAMEYHPTPCYRPLSLRNLFCIVIFFFHNALLAASPESKTQEKGESPPKIGNFILPSSQQPGPFIGFGQHVLDKNQTLLLLFADKFKGHRTLAVDVIPSILYGLTDKVSLSFSLPIAAQYQQNQQKSSGLEDTLFQVEYAFYTKENIQFTEQATVVTSMGFPTGSAQKQPNTGVGATSYFLGATFNRTYVDWFGFISPGATVNSSRHGTHYGNQFIYQSGVGRNLFNIDSSVGSNWIIALMVEISGKYSDKNKIIGMKNPNSGGNTVYIVPSLWISSQNLIIQLGAGRIVSQHLFGNQNKNKYLIGGDLGWTF